MDGQGDLPGRGDDRPAGPSVPASNPPFATPSQAVSTPAPVVEGTPLPCSFNATLGGGGASE